MAEKPPFPLLILSDAPSASTGLGRICRDLATRIHERMSDVCKVATLGYGGPGSCKLGFQQYMIEGMSDWVVPTLPEVWKDFADEEKGAEGRKAESEGGDEREGPQVVVGQGTRVCR